MVMSILHRITGVGLYLGFALLAWWLAAAAMGGEALDTFNWAAGTLIGQLVLFAFTWTLFHHMVGGLRYLIWDTGSGYSRGARFGLSWFTVVGGVVLTLVVWAVVVWL